MNERSSGDLASSIVQSSVDGLFAIDRQRRYTLWNAAMERFAGKHADEVLGRDPIEVFPFLRDLGLETAMERALAGETVSAEAVPNQVPSGETRYFDRLYMPLRDGGGGVIGAVGIVRDVTARRSAEEALRSSQDMLRMAVDASKIGLWSWDIQGDVVLWEDSMCALAGFEPGSAPQGRQGYLALVHPDDREGAGAAIARGMITGHWEDEHRIVRPDGGTPWLLTKGTVSRRGGRDIAVGAVIDVTERRKRDEQDRQAQRLEAVGQLTAGIAHNFNNILMALHANLEFAARAAPPDLKPLLASAEDASVRAADLVRQLMTFAGRNRATQRRVVPVASLVERTVAFCRTTFDRTIEIEERYDAAARASVDAAQLEQALVNILINARDALADANVDAPRLEVEVALIASAGVGTAPRVRIEVRDNGTGMDAPTLARVFEPFFTTKPVGKGTGLGLATTHAIVREHGGSITCASAPGSGTTFSVFLPHESKAQPGHHVAPRPPPASRGAETVLVVDDEEPVRKVVARMLESGGYTPMLAASGQEALDRLADVETAARVALVLLDVSMPGLSGQKLRQRLGEIAPSLRVIYFTGYAFEAPDVKDIVLQKPVSAQRLLEAVREVLDRPA